MKRFIVEVVEHAGGYGSAYAHDIEELDFPGTTITVRELDGTEWGSSPGAVEVAADHRTPNFSSPHTAAHRTETSTSGMSSRCVEPGCDWTYEYD